jgi:hypothetical protein
MLLNYRMRFYLVLFFYVSVFFISCTGYDRKIPPGIIPEHDMAELLTDIHIVDGSLYNIPQQPDSISKHGLGMYLAVLKAHNTDTATFKKSMKFYSTRPDILNEIYTGINSRLTKKLDSLQKIKPKINQDSLNKVKMQHAVDSVKQVKVKAKLDSLQKVKVEKKAKSSKKHKHKKQNALSK